MGSSFESFLHWKKFGFGLSARQKKHIVDGTFQNFWQMMLRTISCSATLIGCMLRALDSENIRVATNNYFHYL